MSSGPVDLFVLRHTSSFLTISTVISKSAMREFVLDVNIGILPAGSRVNTLAQNIFVK